MSYELPEDIGALSAEELESHLGLATTAFRELRESDDLTEAELPTLRTLAGNVAALKAERTRREEAAVTAQEELAALSAEVLGDEAEDETDEDGAEGGESEGDAEGEDVTASAVARPGMIRLNAVRKAPEIVTPTSVVKADETGPAPEIFAAADIPGHRAGGKMDLSDLVPGMIARAQALSASGGGTGLVASYRHPFPEELVVNDLGNVDQGEAATLYAANQTRLPGGNLVAAGGWCAPSETMYDFLNLACADGLWDAPEVQLRRGGLRFFKTPILDVNAMTFLHTEAADIAGTPKACYTIPCPDPDEVRCDAVGVCVRAGLLTQRHFPELITSQLGLVMTAQEIRIRRVLLNALIAQIGVANQVTLASTFGALSAVFSAIALQAADIIERFSLCDNIAIEVVLPWWSRNMFLADVARRNGVSLDEVTVADVQALFTPLGVRVQWVKGLVFDLPEGDPPVSNGIGGATPATVWPDTVQFLMYPAGQIQIGRGAEINLGVVYDHASLIQNVATFAFAEECNALINRAPDGAVRLVNVPVCADGATGAQDTVTCPAP